MPEAEKDLPPAIGDSDSEYDVIRWPINWGGASILTFGLAFVYGNNADYSRGWVRVWAETSVLLVVGLVFGVIGRRRDKKRFPALVGNLLNGGILLTFIAVALAFLYAYFRPL